MIYQPTRGDQRTARQVLANLGEGVPCPTVARLSAGPLGRVVRLLAGFNLTFVFYARDKRHRVCSVGGPAADPVALLIRRLLDDRSSDSSGGCVPDSVAAQSTHLSAFEAVRSGWIESAVDQIVDGLHRRDLSFILGWSLPGECEVRLDCTFGAVRERVDEWLHCFLTERLGDSAGNVTQQRPSMEVAAHA